MKKLITFIVLVALSIIDIDTQAAAGDQTIYFSEVIVCDTPLTMEECQKILGAPDGIRAHFSPTPEWLQMTLAFPEIVYGPLTFYDWEVDVPPPDPDPTLAFMMVSFVGLDNKLFCIATIKTTSSYGPAPLEVQPCPGEEMTPYKKINIIWWDAHANYQGYFDAVSSTILRRLFLPTLFKPGRIFDPHQTYP